MKKLGVKLVLILYSITVIQCDMYFHNPRGSNNRLNENNRDRNNANRLFDSQNNARAGYNVGSLYYYAGSTLNIEWTNQHSCNDENAKCEIVIQYMQSNLLRDGSTTGTIPANPNECLTRNSNGVVSMDCNSKFEYGMHENFYYYHESKLTKRNMGLYTADQNLNMKYSTINTRQNRNGNRYGYECAEERDYYPYWRPSPWIDVAILTGNVTRCQMYQNESQNVKPRYKCEVPYQYLYQMALKDELPKKESEYIPITEEECVKFHVNYTDQAGKVVMEYGKWVEVAAHGVAAPECYEAPWSRDNHNGNGMGGEHNTFNWTIPNHISENMALRIRYNITTGEVPWEADYNSNSRMRDMGPDIYSKFGLTPEEAVTRGYKMKNDPLIDMFNVDADSTIKRKFKLQLAVNTAQYGRTFQDRSHRFAIRQKPENLDCANILNLNVRGKRGNIVQVYPAVEYDYVPNTVRVTKGDCVHPQWTGSDNNNPQNDGQGRTSTDRSNIVPMAASINPIMSGSGQTYGDWGRSYPSHSLENSFFEKNTMIAAATLVSNQFGGDMAELNDAGTYFDLGPQKVTSTGTHHFMCTRNNNFSNRSQKGKLYVTESVLAQKVVGKLGGTVAVNGKSTSIYIEPGTLTDTHNIQLEHHPYGYNPIGTEPSNTDYLSGFVSLAPSEKITVDGKYALMSIELDKSSSGLFHRHIYRTTDGNTWYKLEIIPEVSSDKVVSFHTDSGGHFVASRSVAAGPMAGLVVGLLVAVVLIVGLVYLCRTNKLPLAGYNSKI